MLCLYSAFDQLLLENLSTLVASIGTIISETVHDYQLSR